MPDELEKELATSEINPPSEKDTEAKLANVTNLKEAYDNFCAKHGYPVLQLIEFDANVEGEISDHIRRLAQIKVGELMMAEVIGYNFELIDTAEGEILMGRIETTDSETNSTIMFFRHNKETGRWEIDPDAPLIPKTQDPFHFKIVENGQDVHYIGGVHVEPSEEDPTKVDKYWTVFYKYDKNLTELSNNKDETATEPFTKGPEKMKDIRFIQYLDGKIGIFTRPYATEFGKGRIGYIEIDSMDEFSPEILSSAPLVGGQEDFDPQHEWLGVNDVQILPEPDGRVVIVGHVAQDIENGQMDYHAFAATFNRETRSLENIQIIGTAEDLIGKITPKKKTLHSVLFPGSVELVDRGKVDENGFITLKLCGGAQDKRGVEVFAKYQINKPAVEDEKTN
ncbi:MAG: DUF1861 family protein [bacterium]|nr:DUF1861 family protein [bacterium]